ncbi:MAG: Flp pilus assembly complex ATPase component TadA [Candidatus Ryanbacteria bacterium]|nr:Flp pilus assembly complex ATPase component TadA [Candidatus Ryanbacteria bacterium]
MAFDEEQQKEKLEILHKREEEDLAQLLAQKHRLPYLNLSRAGIDLDALHLISEDTSREAGAAIIKAAGKKLQLAVKNPTSDKTKEAIDELRRQGYEPQLFLVSVGSLEHAWGRYKEISAESVLTSNVINISKGGLADFRSKIKNTRDFARLLTQKITSGATKRVTDLLDLMLAGAFELVVSDIHVEPAETAVHMRVRLDGILQDITSFPHEVHKMLISRVKLVCELKLNVHTRSQDGRFTIRAGETDVEVRVSILPSPYGESIVMRILHPKAISATYEDLGMEEPLRTLIEKELQKPNGMIITTGPTGSGKTTTLYAFIKKLNEPGVKIITIEDPIEYHIQGITQTQTHKESGYTFETGLSAIVRQDPDIILVGEMRNRETAEIGMQASLTGHLVFSTLHTNNAPGTIPRLIDLGVPPNIIAPAINVAIAQRLVRVLCQNCKKKTELPKDQLEVITRLVSTLPPAYAYAQELFKKMDAYSASSCEQCNDTGYKGRVGVFEAFLIDDAMEELILKNPSEAAVREAAVRQGMATLQQDAAIKILSGKTSFDEANRIVGLV